MIVPTPRMLEGLSALAALPEVAGARVLLVSDRGLEAAGHVAQARAYLEGEASEVRVFTAVSPNPTSQDVRACVEASDAVDLFVALGGGSVMDVAKLAALIGEAGGAVTDHVGVHETGRAATLVLVPTTAGTGSDGQASAIVSDARTHRKLACLAPGLAADVVVLDASLTLTCPAEVTAASGLDALTHAVEVAVTTRRSAESDALATAAFVAICEALPVVLERPGDQEARAAMLGAAHQAGLAISHSMLGAAHAAGNALTAHYDLPHGLAVGQMLPAVVRHNAQDLDTARRYAALAAAAGLAPSAEGLAARLDALVEMAGGQASPVLTTDIPTLAAEAASQWTGTFNPRPMDEVAYARLFAEVGA